MENWDDVKIFLALAAKGTQREAGLALGLDQATVGRRIKFLEESLGTKLFDKSSDGYILTAPGRRALEHAKTAERAFLELDRGVASLDKRLQGVVRVAMPGAMANHWLIPQLAPFFEKYPGIHIEFLTGAEVINLLRREADVAIRLVQPTQNDLHFKKMGNLKLAVFASQLLYSKRFKGETDFKKAFSESPFVALNAGSMSQAERQLLSKLPSLGPVVCRSHAWSSVFAAVRASLGLGILPTFFSKLDPNLKPIEQLSSVETPIWLVTHPDIRLTGRVKAFTDYVSLLGQ